MHYCNSLLQVHNTIGHENIWDPVISAAQFMCQHFEELVNTRKVRVGRSTPKSCQTTLVQMESVMLRKRDKFYCLR